MKGKKKNYREYFEDIKPVTDEELEELLDSTPKKRRKGKKEYKKSKRELYRDF